MTVNNKYKGATILIREFVVKILLYLFVEWHTSKNNIWLLYFAIIGIYTIQGIPRSIGIIQPILLFLSISATRIIIQFLF